VQRSQVIRSGSRVAARSAAGMYAAAALVGFVESLPEGFVAGNLLPPAAALVVAALLMVLGHRIPPDVFAPLGTVLVGAAIVANTSGEGALLYMWPTVFAAYFSPRWVIVAGITWTGIVEGTVVWAVLDSPNAFDQFADVLASAAVVAAVIFTLREHNATLLRRLEREASTDSLTGLLNRRAFRERLDDELARSRRNGVPVGLALLDADHFKAVNDRRGHAAGDELLRQLAEVLADQARGTDSVARVGGEEFAVLLPGSDLEGTRALADRVHRALADAGTVTVSVGIAASAPGHDADMLLRLADDALYRAKREGRNRTAVAV
jgi:diguanylate cyclase (GGDEF)-like protein